MATRPEPNFAALRTAAAAVREKSGITWDALAAKTGMERRGLQWLLSGERKGTLEGWWRLAHALEVDLSDLVTHLDDPLDN